MYGILQTSDQQDVSVLQTQHCLELVLSGSVRVSGGQPAEQLQKDDIHFRRNGNYQLSYSENYSSLLFFLENSFIQDFLDQHIITYRKEVFAQHLSPYRFRTTPLIKANTLQAIAAISDPHHFSSCVTRMSAHMILLQILSTEQDATFVTFLRYLISQYKTDIVYFMECNFRQRMSLKEMARLTGRSDSLFKKEFKAQLGMTPFQWLLQRRLTYVQLELQHTERPVSELAYEAGFENISHFSRAFKTRYGISPTEVRKTVQQSEITL